MMKHYIIDSHIEKAINKEREKEEKKGKSEKINVELLI